jgi:hypothetical protein
MSDTTHHAVAIRESDPHAVIATVNNVAGACKAIVAASCIQIQGRNYIKVEGWQSLAAAHGCTASADSVQAIEGGIAATATIRRLTDGAILGQAEGFVGEDEGMWAKRPLYARRAMAQTRAISRACRSAFAHVVVAMNAGHGTDYSTTPAEEVPAEGFDREPVRREVVKAPAPAAPVAKPAGPVWSAEQKAEAKALADAILAHGKDAAQELAHLRNKLKEAAPSDAIDALAELARMWDDIADAAGKDGAA